MKRSKLRENYLDLCRSLVGTNIHCYVIMARMDGNRFIVTRIPWELRAWMED